MQRLIDEKVLVVVELNTMYFCSRSLIEYTKSIE
jgi:hypothetical protein